MEAAKIFVGTFVQVSKLGSGLEIYPSHLLATNSAGVITDFVDSSSDRAKHLLSSIPSSSHHAINHTSFFLPTFSDLHLHAPQTLYLGTGLHLPLMQWLDEYAYKAEERLDADPVLARKVYKRLAERLIENGTGAALMFGTIKEETK